MILCVVSYHECPVCICSNLYTVVHYNCLKVCIFGEITIYYLSRVNIEYLSVSPSKNQAVGETCYEKKTSIC